MSELVVQGSTAHASIELCVPPEVYHADADGPSLNATTIHVLCEQTPLHAWQQHAKLNPKHVREESAAFDMGTVVHDLLLRGIDSIGVVDAGDWRKKAAKEARDQFRAGGLIPLLAEQEARVRRVVESVRAQIASHDNSGELLVTGHPEVTLKWERDGVRFRGRPDWLDSGYRFVNDLKTTGISASTDAFGRQMLNNGLDIQAALYIDGVRALSGITPKFRFIVVELFAPFAVNVIAPTAACLAMADRKIRYAAEIWKRCLDSGSWPGYGAAVTLAPSESVSARHEAYWMEKELAEHGI